MATYQARAGVSEKVVGIVSRANLFQTLASVAGELKPGAADD